jgi:hypothetical protein
MSTGLFELAKDVMDAEGRHDAASLAMKTAELEAGLASCRDPSLLIDLAQKYTAELPVALPAWKRVLELEPNNLTALVGMGWLYWLYGETQDALRQLVRIPMKLARRSGGKLATRSGDVGHPRSEATLALSTCSRLG